MFFPCGLSYLCAFCCICLHHEVVLDMAEQLTWHNVPKVRHQDPALWVALVSRLSHLKLSASNVQASEGFREVHKAWRAIPIG